MCDSSFAPRIIAALAFLASLLVVSLSALLSFNLLTLFFFNNRYGRRSATNYYDAGIDLHQAALLVNVGNNFIAHERFRMALFPKQHSVCLDSSKAWLLYGAFLENNLLDIDGAKHAYNYAKNCASHDKTSIPLLALSQLFEFQIGDGEEGGKLLMAAVSDKGGKGVDCAALTAAAQFSSEVDSDVVASTQFLERALIECDSYGPALRWQGLLLARAGLYDDCMKKLIDSCKWSTMYCAGYDLASERASCSNTRRGQPHGIFQHPVGATIT